MASAQFEQTELSESAELTLERATPEYFYIHQQERKYNPRITALKFRSQVGQCVTDGLSEYCQQVFNSTRGVLEALGLAIGEREIGVEQLRDFYCALQGSDAEGSDDQKRCQHLKRIHANLLLELDARVAYTLELTTPVPPQPPEEEGTLLLQSGSSGEAR